MIKFIHMLDVAIAGVIGAISSAFLTFVVATRKNRRDDFVAIVEALHKDNTYLRERISILELKIETMAKERNQFVTQIAELQSMLHVSK